MTMASHRGDETPMAGSAWPARSEISHLHAMIQGMYSPDGTLIVRSFDRGVAFSVPATAVGRNFGYTDVSGQACSASGWVTAPVYKADGDTSASASVKVRTPVGSFTFPTDAELFAWQQNGQWNAEWPWNMTGYNAAATAQVYGHKAGAAQYIDLEEFSCP